MTNTSAAMILSFMVAPFYFAYKRAIAMPKNIRSLSVSIKDFSMGSITRNEKEHSIDSQTLK